MQSVSSRIWTRIVVSNSYDDNHYTMPYYLPIAGGRIIGFIPFPKVLVLCEMQSVSSRIWTRIVVSISYDDNHYTMPYYLPIAGGRIIGFIPFPRVLVQCEMQSVSSRIWTRVAVSISYDDNHYSTGTSKNVNKRFVPELKKVVRVSRDFYVSVYFTYPYHDYATQAPIQWEWVWTDSCVCTFRLRFHGLGVRQSQYLCEVQLVLNSVYLLLDRFSYQV